MKAFMPQDIFEVIYRNKDVFMDTKITFYSDFGHVFSGVLLDVAMDKGVFSGLLQQEPNRNLQWFSLKQVASISLEYPTEVQRALFKGESFDALAGQPEPGNLVLSREIRDLESRLQAILKKPIKIVLEDLPQSPHRALQMATLRSAAALLVKVLEKYFVDDFYRQEMSRVVSSISLQISETAKVSLKSGILQVDCPWADVSQRWTESQLKQALNDSI